MRDDADTIGARGTCARQCADESDRQQTPRDFCRGLNSLAAHYRTDGEKAEDPSPRCN